MKDHVSNKNLDSKFLRGTGLEFQFSNQPHPNLPGLSSTSSCGQLGHLSQWFLLWAKVKAPVAQPAGLETSHPSLHKHYSQRLWRSALFPDSQLCGRHLQLTCLLSHVIFWPKTFVFILVNPSVYFIKCSHFI